MLKICPKEVKVELRKLQHKHLFPCNLEKKKEERSEATGIIIIAVMTYMALLGGICQ